MVYENETRGSIAFEHNEELDVGRGALSSGTAQHPCAKSRS
jgi:hypothetical protein